VKRPRPDGLSYGLPLSTLRKLAACTVEGAVERLMLLRFIAECVYFRRRWYRPTRAGWEPVEREEILFYLHAFLVNEARAYHEGAARMVPLRGRKPKRHELAAWRALTDHAYAVENWLHTLGRSAARAERLLRKKLALTDPRVTLFKKARK
jgi:hypothetical protein